MIYDHTSEDHLYDDLPHNVVNRTHTSMAQLEQGRTREQIQRNQDCLFYLFILALSVGVVSGLLYLFA